MMNLLQVCNVGQICGGTAACAWTITRALPHCRHSVWFFSDISTETAAAFANCQLQRIDRLTDAAVRASGADLVILHNTAPQRTDRIRSAPTILYAHSAGKHAPADATFACSHWLQREMRRDVPVLWQPVPVPPEGANQRAARNLECELVIGRINTPQVKKWPVELIEFYDQLSTRCPEVLWEFVGAPEQLQAQLLRSCRGRALFHPANWQARRHLSRWDAMLYHHPTLTESFGRTVAEAQRAGCVPIADNRGGFCEQIQSGVSGFLCSNVEEFTNAVRSLQDSLLLWKMSYAARQAGERCSLHRFAHRLETCWHASQSHQPPGAGARVLRDPRRNACMHIQSPPKDPLPSPPPKKGAGENSLILNRIFWP